MTRKIMRRKAQDNPYFHKDFHSALNYGIEYLHGHFGEQAVHQYLREFAASFYRPLTQNLIKRGLPVLKEHFEKIYKTEGAQFRMTLSDKELKIKIKACPAVTHIRKKGRPVARLFVETTKTVNQVICRNTPFSFQMLEYDPKTGASVQRFYRRQQ